MNSNVKRKFNALLQGIGNRPSTAASDRGVDLDDNIVDPASSPASQRSSPHPSICMANDELLNKKRRVGGPTSTPTKYGAPAQSSPASIRTVTSISNVTLKKWTPASASAGRATDDQGGLPPPKYCPGDREQLLRRLATFQELTDWTPKPDRVNEVEWAKRGWVCQGKERVKCTLCSRELVVRVNRKEVGGKEISVLIASEIAESVVDKYVELIVDAHAEDCLWRKKGCDDSLLRLPLPNPKLALQTLRQRYDELCERGPFLPYEFNLRLPPTLDLDTVISHLPPTFFTDPPPPTDKANPPPQDTIKTAAEPPKINRPALALALLGWQSLTNTRINNAPVPNSASCHTCLRRLGLWMFKSREVDPDTGEVLVPAPMDHLDPLQPRAQRNPGGRPLAPGERDRAAWEVLCLVLRNEAFIRERMGGGTGSKGAKGNDPGPGHARSKSSAPATGISSGTAAASTSTAAGDGDVPLLPKTPERRPVTAGGTPRLVVDDDDYGGTEEIGGGDDEETRRKKDQDMMSRLRRVKSLFNTKAGSKLRRLSRPGSRPGTSHSAAGGE
ncbi:NIPA-like protein [Madurella mycetomatis]|uniref:NIPA-like protein n=1 Tax=Madurella mycetomatis TaxID=100816 RepID=A0A150ASC2_9PEZI|nr:NIPA-like protein [Madurella mycetomatis]